MAQRKRQPTADAANPTGAKATHGHGLRILVEPRPPRKRLWFLLATSAALLLWAGFLVAMAFL
jgi:hypothetical protein